MDSDSGIKLGQNFNTDSFLYLIEDTFLPPLCELQNNKTYNM